MNILKLLTERKRVGNLGEEAAVKFLRKKGYKILERNYVGAGHEIDIIAELPEVIAFIEVKTRNTNKQGPFEPRPASSVTPSKQRGIISSAKHYLAFHAIKKAVRLDIIEVYLSTDNDGRSSQEIKHLENAFNLNTAYNHR